MYRSAAINLQQKRHVLTATHEGEQEGLVHPRKQTENQL